MEKYVKYLFLFLLSLTSSHLYAQLQGQAKVDSLLNELPKHKEDTNMVNILNGLAYEFTTIDIENVKKYGQEALELATKLNWKQGIGLSHNSLGWYYWGTGEYDKELECYEKALKLYEEIGHKKFQAGVLSSISDLYRRTGNYAKATEAALKALALAKATKDKNNMSTAHQMLGIIEHAQSNYSKAVEYYLKALEEAKECGNNTNVARIYSTIGGVYMQQTYFTKALDYLLKSVNTEERLGNRAAMALGYENIGTVYAMQDKDSIALEYYLKAVKIFEETGLKQYLADINLNIAATRIRLNQDYTGALACYNKSLKLFEEQNDKAKIANTIGAIGELYFRQKKYDLAADYKLSSLKMYKELDDSRMAALEMNLIAHIYIGIVNETDIQQGNVTLNSEPSGNKYVPKIPIPRSKNVLISEAINYALQAQKILEDLNVPGGLSDTYYALAKAYKLKGDYKKAYEAVNNYYAIEDSVYSRQKKEEILKLTMQNDYDRKRLADSLKVAHQQNEARVKLQRQKSYTYAGIAGVLLLGGFSFFIFKERRKSEVERKKSDELLLNILPEKVADELKARGVTSANHYDNVTVLFTDFVNFTQASESMSPQALIDELHTCFKAFDEITNKYGIEKIKTIGDAYLAVAGLPTADQEHALHVVSAAKEIVAFMSDRLAKLGRERTFEVRIGIHSGSVVAGVVGVKKFAYDIWGDTVNTAARMEQHSEAGKINISQSTYELVKDKFACDYRGEVDAKGKGMLKMYYVA